MKTIETKPTEAQVAARFGCSVEQVKAQYAKNAAQLRQIADEAKGKSKYRGQTPEYWEEKAVEYARMPRMRSADVKQPAKRHRASPPRQDSLRRGKTRPAPNGR